jgi:hypothetical protein
VTQHEAFGILNVGDGSSPAEIGEAFADLVKVWDPCRFDSDLRLRKKAERALQEINQAYALLQGEADALSETSCTASHEAPNAPVAAAAEEPLQEPSEGDDEAETAEESGGTPLIQLVAMGIAAGLAVVALGTTLMFPAPPADPAPASQVASSPKPAEAPLSIEAPATSDAVAAVAARTASETVTPEATTGAVDPARPASGIEMVSPRRTGGGSLVIYNRERRDAVVALTRARVFERAVYIRAGEDVELANVAAGTYRVVMMLGRDWAADRFDRNSSYRELNKPARFTERIDQQGTEYTRLTVALRTPVKSMRSVRAARPFRLPAR